MKKNKNQAATQEAANSAVVVKAATLKNYCNKIKDCGHECDGVRGEPVCPPCLHRDCGATCASEKIKREVPYTLEDECGICFSGLEDSPVILLCRNHVFHANCVKRLLESRWSTMSINFAYLNCPGCKKLMVIPISFPLLGDLYQKELKFKIQIEKMSCAEASKSGLFTSPKLADPMDDYFNNFKGLAMASCTFYECGSCKIPYFGGMNDCRQAMREERSIEQKDLRCQKCLSAELGFGQMTCAKSDHGNEFIDYKCRFCCNIALYVCFNGTHYCKTCHKKACNSTLNFHQNDRDIKCSNSEGKCPLGITDHVQAWRNPFFALGCGLCRSEKLHFIQEQAIEVLQTRLAPSDSRKNVGGVFNPRAMREDKKEAMVLQKELAGVQVRLQRLQNEEEIRMNQSDYIYQRIVRREITHQQRSTAQSNIPTHLISKAMAQQDRSKSAAMK